MLRLTFFNIYVTYFFHALRISGKWRSKFGHKLTVFLSFSIIYLHWYRAYQGTNKTNFLLFKYFLINLFLTVFMQKCAFKTRRFITIKNEWYIFRKNVGTFLFSILSEMCTKFKVDRFSNFGTKAQVCTTQKPFPTEIPLTKKAVTSNSFKLRKPV